MSHEHEVPLKRPPKTDWTSLRGEIAVYALIATIVGTGLAWYQDIEVRKQEIEVTHRLIQRLDTDTLVTERALAHLENREPSQAAQKLLQNRQQQP